MKINPASVPRLVASYLDGASASKLAKLYCVNVKTIYPILRAANVQMRSSGSYFQKLKGGDKERIAREYLAGENIPQLAKKYEIDEARIWVILKQQSVKRRPFAQARRIHSADETVFDVLIDANAGQDDSEHAAYWLGFLIADGCVVAGDRAKNESQRLVVGLSRKDRAHLQKFKEFLKATNKICDFEHEVFGKIHGACNLSVSAIHIIEVLKKAGFARKKARCVRLPWLLKNRHLWRGLIDGDGHVSFLGKGGRPIIGLCGTRTVVQQFLRFAKSVATNTKTKARLTDGKLLWTVHFSGRAAAAIIKELYRDAHVALDRKMRNAEIAFTWRPRTRWGWAKN